MIRIGTSGFSYEDWAGFFYPADLPSNERLAYYARYFDTVEINSTYYRLPHAGLFRHLMDKTPPGFQFVVKAYRGLTHEREAATEETFRQFLTALEPLREENRLGCVLAQFPWSFKPSREHVAFLKNLHSQFGDLPVVVEFRNADWVQDQTFAWLRRQGLGFCCVDGPRLKGLMPDVAVATSELGYVRFHGRNAEKWWQHEEAWERYDYLYSEAELAEWVPKIQTLAAQTADVYVFFNNHYRAQAVRNAQQMQQQLQLLEG